MHGALKHPGQLARAARLLFETGVLRAERPDKFESG
jgi:hypothetical protein